MSSRAGLLAVAILAVGCSDGDDDGGAAGLGFPLAGTLGEDFFYVAGVDHAGSGDIDDHECGDRTYDGHTGTDIGLASFADMEAGVTISAARGGSVIATHDGEPDHNTTWAGQAGLGNYVALDHGDGLVTYYGHMTRDSVAVAVGDAVAAGDALGLVGSSGRSDMPHLHLELQRDGAAVDPFAGPCSGANSEWAQQDPYDLTLKVLHGGFTDQTLSLDVVKQPPAARTTWSRADSTLWFWVLVLNKKVGDTTAFAFYRPDGSLFDTVRLAPSTQFYAVSWWWAYYQVDAFTPSGTWRVDYVHDGSVAFTGQFTVDASATAGDEGIVTRSGTGGGGR